MPETVTSAALRMLLSEKVYQALQTVAQGRRHHVLLDFPSHWNIGDSAIWQGEIEVLLRVHHAAPDYVSHIRYPTKKLASVLYDDTLIYLHGGGNFGDIWPRYQNYREAVIAGFPKHRIVQLPQSLHFGNLAEIERTKRIIGGHPDFHLMVRDQKSFDFASQHFDCSVMLVPDSAFCIDMASFARNPHPRDIGCILRNDKEIRDDAVEGHKLFKAAGVADWQRYGSAFQKLEKGLMGAFMLAPARPTAALAARSFAYFANTRISLGFAQLDRAEVIVTDRLHGHIMATLLGKPHVVIDNFYGKIANFIAAWGADDITLQANSFGQAHEMAHDLLARTRSAALAPAKTGT